MESGGMPEAGGERAAEGVLVWNGVVARVPPLVVRATSAEDVAAALRLARATESGARRARALPGALTFGAVIRQK